MAFLNGLIAVIQRSVSDSCIACGGGTAASGPTQHPDPHAYNAGMHISLPDLEQAINYWRALRPSLGEECALSPEVNALAKIYALMIFEQRKAIPFDALDAQCQLLIESWRTQS